MFVFNYGRKGSCLLAAHDVLSLLAFGCGVALVVLSLVAAEAPDCDTKVFAAVQSATFIPDLQIGSDGCVFAYGRCRLDLTYELADAYLQQNVTASCNSCKDCRDLCNKQGQAHVHVCFDSRQVIPDAQIMKGPEGTSSRSRHKQQQLRIAQIPMGAKTGIALLLLILPSLTCVQAMWNSAVRVVPDNHEKLVAAWATGGLWQSRMFKLIMI